MQRLVAIALAPSVMLFGSVAGAEERYTLDGLDALEKSQSWSELTDHLEDVAPAKRSNRWKRIVENAAVGYAQSQQVDRNPLGALVVADQFTKRYPWLAKSKRFMGVRAELGIRGFEDCYKRRYFNCTERLLPFVEADKGNAKLAMAAAQLVARRQPKQAAMPFFQLALSRSKKKRLGKMCAETDQLDISMFAALNQPNSSRLVKPALAVAQRCWSTMKPDLINHLDADGAYYRANVCPMLLERRALSRQQRAKCR